MLQRKCEICGLRSKHENGTKRFFMAQFPLDKDRCKEWVKVTGNEDLAYIPIEKLHELKFVCGKHFQVKDFNSKKSRLKRTAVPSIRLTSKPLSEEILKEFPFTLFKEDCAKNEDPSTSMDRSGSYQFPSFSLGATAELENVTRPHNIILTEDSSTSMAHASSFNFPCVSMGATAELQIVTRPHNMISTEDSSTSMARTGSFDFPSVSLGASARLDNVDVLPKEYPSIPTVSEKIYYECDVPSVQYTVEVLTEERIFEKAVPDTHSSSADVGKNTVYQQDTKSLKAVKKRRTAKKNPVSCGQQLTPRKKKLVKKLKTAKLKLKALKKRMCIFDSIKSKALKTMLLSAYKNQNRTSQGKRWTENDKALAISMYKKSPKLYRYLRQLIPLPSIRTLQIILGKMPIQPGVNKAVINHLSKKAKDLTQKEKTCVLLFDEMSLKKRLIFNNASDKIEGYQDLGEHGRTGDLADKALVLMLQGVYKKIKQPFAHYFVKGTISSEKLVAIIKNAIKIISEAGFKIIATVCDQGPTNVGALNLLKKFSNQPPDSNYFLVDDIKVFIIYDVPHLFKSIRNNFYEGGELVFDNKTAKWAHLIEFNEKNSKTLHFKKITPQHVEPKFRSKMKVKLAAQVLSNDVSAILKLLAETHKSDKERNEILQTADVIEQLDKIFDATNGPSSSKDIKKGIRENVSNTSVHHKVWPGMKNKLKTMHFRKKDSHLRLKNVRCVNGYYITISSLQDIWSYVKSIGFKYLNLRQLNQDALENLFGLIRQHSPTNQNPTCHHFTAALKSTILTRLSTPIRGANCELDDNQLLLDFRDLVFQTSEVDEAIEEDHSYVSEVLELNASASYNASDLFPALHLPDTEIDMEESLFETFDKQPVVYVSGYLASILTKTTHCHKCCDSLRTLTPGNNKIYSFIALKEWWKDKLSLTYPTLELCQTVDMCVSVFERDVKSYLHNNDIGKYCHLMMLKEVNLNWLCEEHGKDLMDTLLTRLAALLIRNECKKINISLNEVEQENSDKNKISQVTSKAK